MRDHCKKCKLLLLNEKEQWDEICRFCKRADEERQLDFAEKRRLDIAAYLDDCNKYYRQ